MRDTAKVWMFLDGLTVVASAAIGALYKLPAWPSAGTRDFWEGTLNFARAVGVFAILLCGFIMVLLVMSQQLGLYNPARLTGYLNEQRLNVQACFTAGLFLTGTLYLIKAEYVSRGMVLVTIGLVTLALSARRAVYRAMLYRDFDRGKGLRNVLIVGSGPEADALRHHLVGIRHLGYRFMGFVDPESLSSSKASLDELASANNTDALDPLFQQARKSFVDEIFFTPPCDRQVVQGVLEEARVRGVDLRVVVDLYDGLAWDCPVEHIGEFPTIPLHCGQVREAELVLKRLLDIGFSSAMMILLAPVMALVALAIKLSSPGPILYRSERIGKKGIVFTCYKFRTMVADAVERQADVMHMNERDRGAVQDKG